MTINHLFIYVRAQSMPDIRAFYMHALKPLGYTEMICANEEKTLGFGSDYPYVWLQQVPDEHKPYPAHVAVDAPDNHAVDEFYRIALSNGGTDNGGPGNRDEMSRQPFYAAFVHDPAGNNIEAVCVDKAGVRKR